LADLLIKRQRLKSYYTVQSRYYDTDGKLMTVTVMTLQSDRDRVQSRYYDTDGKLRARSRSSQNIEKSYQGSRHDSTTWRRTMGKYIMHVGEL
jgi:hypothetical protein